MVRHMCPITKTIGKDAAVLKEQTIALEPTHVLQAGVFALVYTILHSVIFNFKNGNSYFNPLQKILDWDIIPMCLTKE